MDPQGRIYDMQANFIGTANTQGLEEMGANEGDNQTPETNTGNNVQWVWGSDSTEGGSSYILSGTTNNKQLHGAKYAANCEQAFWEILRVLVQECLNWTSLIVLSSMTDEWT